MKRLTALAVFAIAGVAASAAQAQVKPSTVKIATEGAYEPWNFTGPGGQLQGFEIDLANDLCARMKVKCEIVAQDWDGLIPALNARKFDAIMASMIVTEKRLAAMDFSRPYASSSAGFMVAKTGPLASLPGKDEVIDLEANPAKAKATLDKLKTTLKGKTIGVQGSTSNANFLDKYFKGDVEVREYKTTEQHDLDLQAGRIDAIVAQQTSLKSTLQKPQYATFELAGPAFTGDVFGRGIAVGLRKQDQELKKMFDEAIQAAAKDGTLKKLSEKWFKADVTPQT
jgi:octopine/nopaline transport system substrate-binding protein